MAKTIRAHARAEGGYVKLARSITKLYYAPRRPPRKDVVDRRKLSAIAEDEHVHFSPDELGALDAYLQRFGEGLAQRPLFEKPGLLPSVAEVGHVTFLLGSRLDVELKRVEFSHWDVTGCTSLLREINRFVTNVKFDILEVRRGLNEAEARRAEKAAWAELLEGEGPSLVCLGSPRANHASELVLALMLGVSPHVRKENDPVPPFRFVWRTHMPFPSAFAEPPDTLPSAHRALLGREAYALYLDENFIATTRPTKNRARKTYGVVAAQRRPTGQVWMVISGLTGAATYAAAADMVPELDVILDRVPEGQDAPVCWTPVEVDILENPRSGLYDIVNTRALESRWTEPGVPAKS